jgi:hypothetical protein
MGCRLVVVALLLGLYYLLPIHEGLKDNIRERKTSSSYAKAPPTTTTTTTTKDKITKMFGRNTERRSRAQINS